MAKRDFNINAVDELINSDFFKELQNELDYNFNNKVLLAQAFIKDSYAKEYNDKVKTNCIKDNQILEFYGDIVLKMCIMNADIYSLGCLNSKNYFVSTKNEGELSDLKTALENNKYLNGKCDKYISHLLIGNSDKNNKKYDNARKVKANLIEAIIGAIYLDMFYENKRLSKIDFDKLTDIVDKIVDIKSYINS